MTPQKLNPSKKHLKWQEEHKQKRLNVLKNSSFFRDMQTEGKEQGKSWEIMTGKSLITNI